MTLRTCPMCGQQKPLEEFHRHPTGPLGRHSWCKPCANQRQRETRKRNASPEKTRRWQIKGRYGLTPADVDRMLKRQKNGCAICRGPMRRMCVDHSHESGKVRGLLCHHCNIRLSTVENAEYMRQAKAYLRRFK